MPSSSAHYFRIGDLSKLFSIGVDSIRYYEKVGLLHPIRNPENNYRLYTIDDVRTMNTIRELLDLGFGTDEILSYETDRNLKHVLGMLEKENGLVNSQIDALTKRRNSIKSRIRSIHEALSMLADGEVHERSLPVRECMLITEKNIPDEMINYMLAKFTAGMSGKTSTIGACDCYTLDLEAGSKDGDYPGKNVFFYSPYLQYPCNHTLPAGTYASIIFRGPYSRTKEYAEKLLDYISAHNLRRTGDVIELCHIDRYETSDISEYVTELQAPVAGNPE